jgi:hypothetical protein
MRSFDCPPGDLYLDRPFQLMRLKGKGRYYLTDKNGLPEPNQRILRRSQVEQLCPKVIEQGRLEILAFNQPHRVWGISDGDMSFAQSTLIPVGEWSSSESSLVSMEDSSPATDRYAPRPISPLITRLGAMNPWLGRLTPL